MTTIDIFDTTPTQPARPKKRAAKKTAKAKPKARAKRAAPTRTRERNSTTPRGRMPSKRTVKIRTRMLELLKKGKLPNVDLANKLRISTTESLKLVQFLINRGEVVSKRDGKNVILQLAP